MSEVKHPERLALALMVILALWAASWGYSIIHFIATPPSGDGFARGMNRVTGFFGWQGVAGLFAIAAWGISRALPQGAPIRRLSAIPALLALLLALVLAGIVLWARAGG